jgi:hypothetical protein
MVDHRLVHHRHLPATLPFSTSLSPSASHLPNPAITTTTTPQTMQRVLSSRCVVERLLREHREEARWQLARADDWVDKVCGGMPV